MPQSVTDRLTVDFEYIFFLTKEKNYCFEQQLEEYLKPLNRWAGDNLQAKGVSHWDKGTGQRSYRNRNMRPNPQGRNMRSVWSVNTQAFKGAHFAVYPEKLIEPMIRAGCVREGIVLDPFLGSGTTAKVALSMDRHFIGFELNSKYCKLADQRLRGVNRKFNF
jgi:site-specific DNA-methyltransferase (adenine-specific)